MQGDEEEMGYKAQHSPVEYSGPGEVFVRHIANATYGGQVGLLLLLSTLTPIVSLWVSSLY